MGPSRQTHVTVCVAYKTVGKEYTMSFKHTHAHVHTHTVADMHLVSLPEDVGEEAIKSSGYSRARSSGSRSSASLLQPVLVKLSLGAIEHS